MFPKPKLFYIHISPTAVSNRYEMIFDILNTGVEVENVLEAVGTVKRTVLSTGASVAALITEAGAQYRMIGLCAGLLAMIRNYHRLN